MLKTGFSFSLMKGKFKSTALKEQLIDIRGEEESHLQRSAPSRNAIKTKTLKKEQNSEIVSIEEIPTTCSSVQECIARFGRSCRRRTEEHKHSHV